MSESIVPADNNCIDIDSSKRDDVKCPAQTLNKVEPSGEKLERVIEIKGGSNTVASDEVRYRKRRKTRRGKSKRRRLKPYSKLSWQERREQDDSQSNRANKVRAQMFKHGQPVAPYNTTQFLMEDHNDLQDLDVKLKAGLTNNSERLRANSSVFQRPPRVRDSSLSVDSEDEYFYSSPEDEEEFLTKEFSNAYEDLHVERLNQMSKADLIQEYLQLEEKVDSLEKRLKKYQGSAEIADQVNDVDTDNERGEMQVDDEGSPKCLSYQQETQKLKKENEQLRRENECLRQSFERGETAPSVSSSVDSESDSTCSSASDSSDDSSDGENGEEDRGSANENENKDTVTTTSDTNNAEGE